MSLSMTFGVEESALFGEAFLSERRHVGLGGDSFEPRAVDGGFIPIVAAERDGPANDEAKVLPVPKMADTDADRRVGHGPRLFEADSCA